MGLYPLLLTYYVLMASKEGTIIVLCLCLLKKKNTVFQWILLLAVHKTKQKDMNVRKQLGGVGPLVGL